MGNLNGHFGIYIIAFGSCPTNDTQQTASLKRKDGWDCGVINADRFRSLIRRFPSYTTGGAEWICPNLCCVCVWMCECSSLFYIHYPCPALSHTILAPFPIYRRIGGRECEWMANIYLEWVCVWGEERGNPLNAACLCIYIPCESWWSSLRALRPSEHPKRLNEHRWLHWWWI